MGILQFTIQNITHNPTKNTTQNSSPIYLDNVLKLLECKSRLPLDKVNDSKGLKSWKILML